jgi:signal transduction histidine kinase
MNAFYRLRTGLAAAVFLATFGGFQAQSGLANPVDLQDIEDRYDLNEEVRYLEDPEGDISWSEIDLDAIDGDFQGTEGQTPSFGWTDSIYWFHFQIYNSGKQARETLLEIAWPLLDHIEIKQFDESWVEKNELALGDRFPFQQRPIDHTNFMIPLTVEAESTMHLVLRVHSTSSVQLPMSLWKPVAYYESREFFSVGQGLYYGAMLVMVLYNLFIYLSVRRSTYLFYVSFVLGFITLQSSLKGISFQYVWPSNPGLTDVAISTGGAITLWFVVTFAKSFLKIDPSHRRMYPIILFYQIAIAILALVSLFVPYQYIIKLVAGITAFAAPTVIVCGSIKFLNGQREARFYVAAWMVIVLGCVAYMLKQFGLIPRNFFTENAMQFGSILEVVLLSFALADRLNTLKRELESANRKLEAHVANVEAEVEAKTRDIRSIMNTIRQGIFMITSEGLSLHPDYSNYSETILGENELANRRLTELLFDRSDLLPDEKAQVEHALTCSLGEHWLNFEANIRCLPQEITFSGRHGDKVLELSWDPIINKDEIVERVLVSVRDVTEYRDLVKKNQQDEQNLDIVLEIVRLGPVKFARTLEFCCSLINESESSDVWEQNFAEVSATILRNLHTIKGQARSVGLHYLTNLIHAVETETSLVDVSDQASREQVLIASVQKVRALLNHYDDTARNKLGMQRQGDFVKVLGRDQAENWVSQIRRAFRQPDSAAVALLGKMERMLLEELSEDMATVICESFEDSKKIAKSLGKAEPTLQIDGPKVFLPQESADLLRRVLSHVIHNSLDHGIEPPSERTQRQKSPNGTIYVSYWVDGRNGRLLIRYRDDGRGIAIKRLREKATAKGLTVGERPEDVAQLVFTDSLSTATQVTTVSGRGVGMQAAATFLESHGGDVVIQLGEPSDEDGHYYSFTIMITLPKSFYRFVKPLEIEVA